MNYEEFQEENVSEKIVLAKIKASKRLIAFSLHAGSIYKIENFDYPVIEFIKDSGVSLTETESIGQVTAGKFFNDVLNKVLYLRTSDSVNPNGKFISMKFWNFYSNVGISLSYDLNTGEDVYWLPLIRSTSDFGNELDNEEQLGFALEGAGQIVLGNDRDYWDSRYENWVWENQVAEIYSYSRDLDPSEAKIIYKGKVVGKSFSTNGVNFKLKDQILALRQPYQGVDNLVDISGALIPEALEGAKQRRIYGRVDGFLPTNIDQIVDGYTLSGTISTTAGSEVITGVGTDFLDKLSPEDEIILTIFDEEENFTIKSVISDTSLELTESVDVSLPSQPLIVRPALPKKYINRRWLVAGHECNQPTRTVTNAFSLNRFTLNDVTDLKEGDEVFVADELVFIDRINGNDVVLAQNLLGVVNTGSTFIRPCVQNVRWNNKRLIFDRDYTIDFTGGKTFLTLTEEAEKNVRSVRAVNGVVTITNGLRSVTGTDTQFTKQLEPNGWLRTEGEFEFFEILSIESDTELTLRTAATYTHTDNAQYLGGQNFNPEIDHLSFEVTGTTDDGLFSGNLLYSASRIVQDILEKSDITDINQDAFDKAHDVAGYTLGFVIPKSFSDTSVKNIREIINEINISVFGSLVQNEDIEIEYNILRPNKPPDAVTLEESDIISLNIESSNERASRKAIVNYKIREFDYVSGLFQQPIMYEKVSDVGNLLVESMQDKTINTVLFYENDARILANRWAFLLELGTNVIKLNTKLKTTRLQINDIVKISHEKLFNRIGGGKVKYAAIQGIKKNGLNVSLELDDLSNMFNRVGIIAETGSPEFDDSNLEQKAKHGFITDSYGLINNDENTFSQNLIW